MTPTAIELWNDKAFIKIRIREQFDYQSELRWRFQFKCILKQDRYRELLASSETILIRFQHRLTILNSK